MLACVMEALFFSRQEFACKCGCGFDTVDVELIQRLTEVRMHFDAPVTITSGCRCAEHNKRIGGSPKSQHLLGRAADFIVRGVSPVDVNALLNESMPESGGVGLYNSFNHVDSRIAKARWSNH